jgi:glutathione S-transferase
MRGVPTLEVDGVRLYQSSAIIEYLERSIPIPAAAERSGGAAHVRALRHRRSDMHPVNNLRIRNFMRDSYKQDADGVAAWIQLWNKAGFDAFETMLRADKTAAAFVTGSADHRRRVPCLARVLRVRFKTDMNPYTEIRAVVENCNALRPFADAASEQALTRAPERLPLLSKNGSGYPGSNFDVRMASASSRSPHCEPRSASRSQSSGSRQIAATHMRMKSDFPAEACDRCAPAARRGPALQRP